MNNNNTDERLRTALTTVAERVTPEADWARVVAEADSGPPSRAHSTLGARVVVMAAAVIVVVSFGLLALVDVGQHETTAAAGPDGLEEPLNLGKQGRRGPEPGELIVWMEVGVEGAQVEVVAAELERLPAVTGFAYIDMDATYDEFLAFFVDEPEIVELVEPEQLPTSFVVRASDVQSVAEMIEGLAGVVEVDVTEW